MLLLPNLAILEVPRPALVPDLPVAARPVLRQPPRPQQVVLVALSFCVISRSSNS
jgi:hypothetical protein